MKALPTYPYARRPVAIILPLASAPMLLAGCSGNAGLDTGAGGVEATIAGILLAAVLFAVAAALLMRWRLVQARVERTQLRAELNRIHAALAGAPCGYLAWNLDDGRETGSPGLAQLVGIDDGGPVTWARLRHCFAEPEAMMLDDAIGALRTAGTSFALTATTRDGGRSFRIAGGRSGAGCSALDALWLQDATAAASDLGRLAADAADLAAERDRLRVLLDLLPLPVWQRARDLSLAYCNRAYAAAVEAETAAAAVLDEREIAAGGLPSQGQALAERARRTGSSQSESRHVVIGGGRRLLEFTEVPVGTSGLIGGFAQDFTSVESVQADLGRYVDAHAEVLEQLRSGIAMFAPDRRLKFFNRAYATLWRLDPEWLRTEPDLGEIMEVLRERRRLPEVVDFRSFRNMQLQRFNAVIEPEEEYLYLPDETTVRQITAPHPLGGLMLIFEDVTDRLAVERSYNTMIAVQRETLNELREGVAVFGTDGRLKLSNPAYRRIWNFSQEDVDGEPHIADLVEKVRPLYHVEGSWEAFKAEIVARIMHRVAATGRYTRSDGKVLDFAMVPLPDGSMLNSESDVTDTYNVEHALVERNAALQEADRLKTEFLANISYELRTPLNTIIGFAEILSNGYFGELNPRQNGHCAGILEASQQLLSLINDILDLAMVEAGQIVLDLGQIDIEAMMANVLNLTRERARKQNLRITMSCAPDVGAIVGDERRLKQVLFNLVSNAVKFTPPGGSIEIAAERMADVLQLRVTDTGIGIRREDQERVFGAFEHARTGENRPAGAGLGLTLVKRFIEMHGGRIELASGPDEGTEVRCHLPLDAGTAPDGRRLTSASAAQ